MKTRITSLSILIIALTAPCALALAATPASKPAALHPVRIVEKHGKWVEGQAERGQTEIRDNAARN